MRILLIEGDPAYARLVQKILTEEIRLAPDSSRLDFIWAEGLAEGLPCLGRIEIDLLLVDLSLSDAQGFQVFYKIRARAPDVPVVVLTTPQDEPLGVRMVQEGGLDSLVKNHVDAYLLRHAMHHALEWKHAREEREQLLWELGDALARVRVLQALLNMCSHCKKIRTAGGQWQPFDQYLSHRLSATPAHVICPTCFETYYQASPRSNVSSNCAD